MSRVTRRQMKSWLAPIRSCFAQMRTGEVDAIRGYAVTRVSSRDEYARIDFCIAGFRALIARLCPHVDVSLLERIEKKLAAGVVITVGEIDSAFATLRQCEDALVKKTVDEIKDAVITEQIQIEFDEIKEAA